MSGPLVNPYRFDRPTYDPNAWVAPEHYFTALHMERRRGELVIELNPIFAYSRRNPPAWLAGNVRLRLYR